MKVKISTSPTQSELEEIDLSSTTRRGAECIIGRSPDSDVVLDSQDVSRHHGKFFCHSGNYYFSDLGSRNGTIINGKLVEKNHSQILKDGDVIRIGDFALMLQEDIVVSEQSETVVKIINPSMFSNWQGRQSEQALSEEVSDIVTPLSESVNQVEEVNTSGEITFTQPDEVIAENSAEENISEIAA
ncbi:FHA domain-containing protein, partial [Rivularia sp. UHCC 0363]|uniref:FHA domain-containing protein n=1 Tax=Rivularia sp. UHCC 0363 TaxID=3110244 RepID=UPI002B20CBE5